LAYLAFLGIICCPLSPIKLYNDLCLLHFFLKHFQLHVILWRNHLISMVHNGWKPNPTCWSMIEGKIPETRSTITTYTTCIHRHSFMNILINIATNGEKLSFEELSFYIWSVDHGSVGKNFRFSIILLLCNVNPPPQKKMLVLYLGSIWKFDF